MHGNKAQESYISSCRTCALLCCWDLVCHSPWEASMFGNGMFRMFVILRGPVQPIVELISHKSIAVPKLTMTSQLQRSNICSISLLGEVQMPICPHKFAVLRSSHSRFLCLVCSPCTSVIYPSISFPFLHTSTQIHAVQSTNRRAALIYQCCWPTYISGPIHEWYLRTGSGLLR